ncbi:MULTISPECIES: D-alanine--D-alanine ligase family protein [unclassified Rathayibacter]|uniref:D-alanine--D-alanine ligase family protein n=1 Tax=unclassified Rathayibacter TaxID=2609250 RepID=UPI000CE8802A|nr:MULTISPECIES: D-alanine--D-alanine ligase family protein [unclassified Rathayibacter]PPF30073.1 D-alanine--D-alanine ligase [Rathayibacter sp. AY1F2]PPH44566.1 D-alanine--D-alanine ligase [Rathayibacter sp. AY1F7]
MTSKLRVAVLFGGRSSEHSISCATAAGVLRAIDRDRFEVILVGITSDGAFVLEEDRPEKFALDAASLPRVEDDGSRVRWPESALSRELTVTTEDGATRSLGEVDVVLPILHGPWGEDGTVQGMLELVGLPYVGSGVLASALGMDKHFTKTVLRAAGLAVAPWYLVTEAEWRADPGDASSALDELGLPAFVKPARAGSSVGVSRIDEREQLEAALEEAFAHDSRVLIESGIVGREVEIGVLGGRRGAPARASVAGEVVVTGRGFYDFEAKYLGASGIELVCPADLTDGELSEMRSLAIRAFDAIGAEGLARVDFFLTADGFVVNEINTMPGFTPVSMFPRMWGASGVDYPDLISELLDSALDRVPVAAR